MHPRRRFQTAGTRASVTADGGREDDFVARLHLRGLDCGRSRSTASHSLTTAHRPTSITQSAPKPCYSPACYSPACYSPACYSPGCYSKVRGPPPPSLGGADSTTRVRQFSSLSTARTVLHPVRPKCASYAPDVTR